MPEGPPDRLIHDPAGTRLSKQFRDKESSSLKPPIAPLSPFNVLTPHFFSAPLCSSSVVKGFLRWAMPGSNRITLSQQKVDQAAVTPGSGCLSSLRFTVFVKAGQGSAFQVSNISELYWQERLRGNRTCTSLLPVSEVSHRLCRNLTSEA